MNLSAFMQNLSDKISPDHLNALLLVGVAIFGGTIGGRLFRRLRIPQVVGYIIIGILAGKMGANLFSGDVLDSFTPFNDFALGVIGFLIGGELNGVTLKKYGKQFTWILFFEALTAFFLSALLVFFTILILFHNAALAAVFGLLLGSISAATAAAGTTDVLWENRTRGPLTTTILGIIALDDILALFLFAIVASMGGMILGGESGSVGHELLRLLYEIGGAVVIGGIAGLVLARILRRSSDRERTLSFSLGGILVVLGFASVLGIDTIMSAMIMGVVMTNIAPKKSKEVFHIIEGVAPPLYILFFVFVGAGLNVSAMNGTLYIIALVYLVGRSLGKIIGAWMGATFGKSPKTVRKYLPFSLFSQSGVAIGLAIVASQRFPGQIGETISLVVTATTLIVQLLGPVVLKWAVIKSGEAGLNIGEEDIIRQSKVGDVVDRDVPVLQEGLPISRVLERISESDSLFFPVVNQKGEIRGTLSMEGVKNAFIARELTDLILTLDLMEPVEVRASENESLEDLIEDMNLRQEEFVPVIDDKDKPLGMVETRGIQRYLSRRIIELQSKADSLG